MPKALLAEIEAGSGREEEIATFLRDALDAAQDEPDTRDWYALRFDARRFAVFDTFDGNAGRLRHMAGRIGRGLLWRSVTSLSGLPEFSAFEIVAARPANGTRSARHALYTPIETRMGQGRDFGEALVGLKALVVAEAGTVAWYALRLGPNHFAVLHVFEDEAARAAHLEGQAAAALGAQVGRFLDAMPEQRPAAVLASKQSGWEAIASAEQQVHPEQAVRIGPEPA